MKTNKLNTLSFMPNSEQERAVSVRERLANLDRKIQNWSLLILPSIFVIASSAPENFLVPAIRGGLIIWMVVASTAMVTERHNQDEAQKLRQKVTS